MLNNVPNPKIVIKLINEEISSWNLCIQYLKNVKSYFFNINFVFNFFVVVWLTSDLEILFTMTQYVQVQYKKIKYKRWQTYLYRN
jgi:hypothetical protein